MALVAAFGVGVLVATWCFLGRAPADSARALNIPTPIVALAQQTKVGGAFMVEVDAQGRVSAYSAEIELAQVPAVCMVAANQAAPGGQLVSAERQVIGGKPYYEVEKNINGLRLELLVDDDGDVAGREEEILETAAPASVLEAANGLMPAGKVVAVEHVTGPETLGGPEHHVKKLIAGEIVRIRVTEAGAVEELRKLKMEMKVPVLR